MWYYIKDKKRVGPVSDVSMEKLFQEKEISVDTNVWDKEIRKWVPFCNTMLFKRITAKLPSASFVAFRDGTYKFRGLLTVVFFYILYCAYFTFGRLTQCVEISLGKISDLQLDLITREYSMSSWLVQMIFIILILALSRFLFEWFFSATKAVRAVSRDYKLTATFSAFSMFIPFFNVIYPCSWLIQTYSAALQSGNKKWRVYDVFLVTMWWFFTVLSLVVFAINTLFVPNAFMSDIFKVVFYFSIYTDIIMCTALIFWILIVTRLLDIVAPIYKGLKG